MPKTTTSSAALVHNFLLMMMDKYIKYNNNTMDYNTTTIKL